MRPLRLRRRLRPLLGRRPLVQVLLLRRPCPGIPLGWRRRLPLLPRGRRQGLLAPPRPRQPGRVHSHGRRLLPPLGLALPGRRSFRTIRISLRQVGEHFNTLQGVIFMCRIEPRTSLDVQTRTGGITAFIFSP